MSFRWKFWHRHIRFLDLNFLTRNDILTNYSKPKIGINTGVIFDRRVRRPCSRESVNTTRVHDPSPRPMRTRSVDRALNCQHSRFAVQLTYYITSGHQISIDHGLSSVKPRIQVNFINRPVSSKWRNSARFQRGRHCDRLLVQKGAYFRLNRTAALQSTAGPAMYRYSVYYQSG